MKIEIISQNVDQTNLIAQTIAKTIKAPEVISLCGDLGSGKTTFAKYFIKALGIIENVTSPTFTLLNEYELDNIKVYHFDMYRVHTMDELYSTGFYDYLGCGSILAIEWSENIASALKWESCIFVSIEQDGENTRTITVNGGDRF